jgi:hypothetical protein
MLRGPARVQHGIQQALREIDGGKLLVVQLHERFSKRLELLHFTLALSLAGKLVRHGQEFAGKLL